jgi:hypothetical protein
MCLSWSRSSYLRSRYGTGSRKPFRTSGNVRAHPGPDKDVARRILELFIILETKNE